MKNDCAYVQNQFSAYIDGMLTEKEAETVRKHLAQCEICQKEFAFLSAITKEAAELPVISVNEALHTSIMQQVLQAKKPAVKRFGGRKVWQTASAFVAAAAVIAISVISFGNLPSHPDLTVENPAVVTHAPEVISAEEPAEKMTQQPRTPSEQAPSVATQTTPEIPVYEEPSSYARTPERRMTEEQGTVFFYFTSQTCTKAAEMLSAYQKDGEGYRIPVEEFDALKVRLTGENGYLRHAGEVTDGAGVVTLILIAE